MSVRHLAMPNSDAFSRVSCVLGCGKTILLTSKGKDCFPRWEGGILFWTSLDQAVRSGSMWRRLWWAFGRRVALGTSICVSISDELD